MVEAKPELKRLVISRKNAEGVTFTSTDGRLIGRVFITRSRSRHSRLVFELPESIRVTRNELLRGEAANL